VIVTKQKEIGEKKLVSSLLDAWYETRLLTYDLINKTPLEKLNEKIERPGLDTLAKQIYELSLVQKAYVDVLEGKSLDFSGVEGITLGRQDYIAESKYGLSKLLDKVEVQFKAVVDKIESWSKEVILFEESLPLYSVLDLMIRHETLHHGQFIIFCYTLGIKFPDSWVNTWALPQKQ